MQKHNECYKLKLEIKNGKNITKLKEHRRHEIIKKSLKTKLIKWTMCALALFYTLIINIALENPLATF